MFLSLDNERTVINDYLFNFFLGLSMSKNKYLVDPSVQQPSSGNINTFNPLNTAYNNSPIQNLPSSQTSPSLSGYNNSRQDVFNQPAG